MNAELGGSFVNRRRARSGETGRGQPRGVGQAIQGSLAVSGAGPRAAPCIERLHMQLVLMCEAAQDKSHMTVTCDQDTDHANVAAAGKADDS
jgi:hypothetical protein